MLSNEKMDMLMQIRNALLFLVEREVGGRTYIAEMSFEKQQKMHRESAENVLKHGNPYGPELR